ncbi:MAG: HlyC/CorC family transporter [Candidatus Fimadaptatus sp.]|jgi:putative hemolysin
MNIGLQIVILALLIMMSAFFSATETAFMSANRVRLKSLSENGSKKAAKALALSEHYDELLTAILVGNNLVNIGSASLATVLFTQCLGDAGVTVSTVVMTILVLIFGEVCPKSLAKERPEQFSMFAAPVMAVLTKLLLPVSYLFILLKRALHKLMPQGDEQERAITEDELMTYVDEAEDDGGIDEHESALIRSAIEFHDRDVEEILTPRVDISAISDEDTIDEIAQVYDETGYSRLPVYHGSIDNIVGVLHERDFYSSQAKGEFVLEKELGQVLYVQGGLKISALMRRLQLEKLHMAIVLDEFGGTLGLVTLEDVIEELVGEIWDEHDEVIEFFMPQEDGSTLVNAGANLDDLFEYFDWGKAPDDIDAVTASGWAIENLGFIPQPGDNFTYRDRSVTITQADKRHVLELSVSAPIQPAADDDGDGNGRGRSDDSDDLPIAN